MIAHQVTPAPLSDGVLRSNSGKQRRNITLIGNVRATTLRWHVRANQSLQRLDRRRNRSEKPGLIADGQQHGRKVLNVQRVEQIGFIFHIDPQEPGWCELGPQLLKTLAVVTANTAPLGAKTNDKQTSRWRGVLADHRATPRSGNVSSRTITMPSKLIEFTQAVITIRQIS